MQSILTNCRSRWWSVPILPEVLPGGFFNWSCKAITHDMEASTRKAPRHLKTMNCHMMTLVRVGSNWQKNGSVTNRCFLWAWWRETLWESILRRISPFLRNWGCSLWFLPKKDLRVTTPPIPSTIRVTRKWKSLETSWSVLTIPYFSSPFCVSFPTLKTLPESLWFPKLIQKKWTREGLRLIGSGSVPIP